MAAEKPIVSWLTGSGAGFYDEFHKKESSSRFSDAPPEVQEKSLLVFVLRRYIPPDVDINMIPMTVWKVSDISGGHHAEVLDLLLLGLGAVAPDKAIWLASPLVEHAYSEVGLPQKLLLEAILGGLHDAMGALPPLQNENLALSRHLAMNKGEVAAVLAKITAAKAEEETAE